MGLLNKLKNAIFEEEEVEINEPVEEVNEKPAAKPSKKKEPVKMTFKDDDDDVISDRELFKAEPTFDFPAFDEDEFLTQKKEDPKREQPVKKEIEKTMEVKPRTPAPTVMDMERRSRAIPKTEPKRSYEYKESRKPKESTANDNKHFIPSPVISPVYGVLDKNYKKEDIIVKNETTKKIDVDSVRRKAFGTLEDDIEKTLNTPSKEFYQKRDKEKEYRKEGKHLDDLLKDSAEDVITVPEKEETILEKPAFNIEEESVKYRKERNARLENLDKQKQKSVEEKLEDETLENDLFDLIDSMYENREDGDES